MPALTLDEPSAAKFARLALNCVSREYPSKIAHVLYSQQDARTPRELQAIAANGKITQKHIDDLARKAA